MGQCVGAKSSARAVADKEAAGNASQGSNHRKRRRRHRTGGAAAADATATGAKDAMSPPPPASATHSAQEAEQQQQHAASAADARAAPARLAAHEAAEANAVRDGAEKGETEDANDENGIHDSNVRMHDGQGAGPRPRTAAEQLVLMESVTHRLEQGSAYQWLKFSYANPHLTAQPLVRSSRQLALLLPHAENVSTGHTALAHGDGQDNPRGKRGGEATAAAVATPTSPIGEPAVLKEAPGYPVVTSLEVSLNEEGKEKAKADKHSGSGQHPNTRKSVDVDRKFYEATRLSAGRVYVRRPGEIRGHRFDIEDCHGATVLLLDLCGSVSISRCAHCFFFIGPTVGTVELDQCHGCVLVAACGQVRLRWCAKLVLSLLTAGLPMLESSSSVGLTSLSGWYAYNEMPLHLRAARLSPFINNYSTVRDVTPPAPQPHPRRPGGGGGRSAKHFYYLDPWDFDFAIWHCAVATALRGRGLSRNVSFGATAADLGSHPSPLRSYAARSTPQKIAAPSASPRERGRGRGLALFSDLNREGTTANGSFLSMHTALTAGDADDDEPFGRHDDDVDDDNDDDDALPTEAGHKNGAHLAGTTVRRDRQRLPRQRRDDAAQQRLASTNHSFDVETAQQARSTLMEVPLRLLDLPIATVQAAAAGAAPASPPDGKQKKKSSDATAPTPVGAGNTSADGKATRKVSMQLPPLSPLSVEDVLTLYTDAIVAPTTLGASLIPKQFFKDKWRLKLFVVANKNGGWAVAERIARDIELSRRQCFMEYARTVPAAASPAASWKRGASPTTRAGGHTAASGGASYADSLTPHWQPPVLQKGQGRAAGHASEDDAAGEASALHALEHRYIPLAHRCGPVLLLNTVELRCTETVMREYVAPTFYKLTEPAEVEHLRQQQQQQQQEHKTGKEKWHAKGSGGGGGKKTAEQRTQEEAELRRSVAIRRLFGEAVQRMSGQACVFLLALVAPSDGARRRHSDGANRAGEAGHAAATATAQHRPHTADAAASDGSGSDGDEEEGLGEHEVGNDNSAALSRYARRQHRIAKKDQPTSSTSGGGVEQDRHRAGVVRTQARRLNGQRVFQPLSKEEEEDDEYAQPDSADDDRDAHASTLSGNDESRSSRSSSASSFQEDRRAGEGEKRRRANKRIDTKRRADAARRKGADAGGKATGFTQNDETQEKSQEERVWPRCVLLNVTVPIHFVSMLQSNVFFKAALMSASTSGGCGAAQPPSPSPN